MLQYWVSLARDILNLSVKVHIFYINAAYFLINLSIYFITFINEIFVQLYFLIGYSLL